jgi:hypothetical protein
MTVPRRSFQRVDAERRLAGVTCVLMVEVCTVVTDRAVNPRVCPEPFAPSWIDLTETNEEAS